MTFAQINKEIKKAITVGDYYKAVVWARKREEYLKHKR